MRWPASALLTGTLTTAGTLALAAGPAMFRGDAPHRGVYDAAGIAVLHGVRWTFRTGAAVISTPAVAGGSVYVGSSDHNFYALDAASGALRWKFATRGRVSSSPAIAAGRVYFGSFDSNLYALDAGSGTLVWKFTSAGERRFSGKHLHGAEPAAFPPRLSLTVACTSAAAMATCTRSMRRAARSAGPSRPALPG